MSKLFILSLLVVFSNSSAYAYQAAGAPEGSACSGVKTDGTTYSGKSTKKSDRAGNEYWTCQTKVIGVTVNNTN